MITIIYTTTKDQLKAVPVMKELRANPKDKASARVIEFWEGEVESCDQVLVGEGCGKVADAYKSAGITVKDLFDKPKKVEEVKPVEVAVVAEPVTEATTPEVQVEQPQESRGRGRPRKDA